LWEITVDLAISYLYVLCIWNSGDAPKNIRLWAALGTFAFPKLHACGLRTGLNVTDARPHTMCSVMIRKYRHLWISERELFG
jgi:hypothetical protein